ncbi:hypothetical protein RIF29_25200 [Crotalaria pallida]|uniref:Uncharacterized protein n=1 Tax=Crotalaria pallida TaxID=3830 RepID=A0AAN9ENK4_CROPI
MASKFSLPDNESIGSSDSNGSNKTISDDISSHPYKTESILITYQSKNEACNSQMSINDMNTSKSKHNPLRKHQPPLLSSAPSTRNATSGKGYLKRYHPYARQEVMPIATSAPENDHGSSTAENKSYKTLDLISLLDPTRNFLCLIDQQSLGQSGKATNGSDAALDLSNEKGAVDLKLKL